MCEVTQSFFDEGKIVGAVQILRNVNHLEDEEIVEIIKKEFNLNDFQAKTFVYPRETATA